ncbi:MAG TPA: hypothetical protein VIH87_15215 [Methylocella sp.]
MLLINTVFGRRDAPASRRCLLRQTIGLGGGTKQIEAGANQLAGPVA